LKKRHTGYSESCSVEMASYIVRMKNGVVLQVRADSVNEAQALALHKMRSMGYDYASTAKSDKDIASTRKAKKQ
jgi:hypothetical protein